MQPQLKSKTWLETVEWTLADGSCWERSRHPGINMKLSCCLPATCKRVLTLGEARECSAIYRSGVQVFRSPWPGITIAELVTLADAKAEQEAGELVPGYSNAGFMQEWFERVLTWEAPQVEAELALLVLAGLTAGGTGSGE